MKTNTGRTIAVIGIALLLFGAASVHAQKKGQSMKIHHGYVIGAEYVDLNDSNATKGAIVGGTIAVLATSSRASGKRTRRNAVGGALLGAAMNSGGKKMGMLYTVGITGGAIKVVTDQTEVRLNDCVVVEESSGGANIRRVSAEVCDPAAAGAVAALDEEFKEEAAECSAAKAEVAAAQTDEALDLAMRKVSILCNG